MKTYETPQIFEAGRGSKLIQGQITPNDTDHVLNLNKAQDVQITMLDD